MLGFQLEEACTIITKDQSGGIYMIAIYGTS